MLEKLPNLDWLDPVEVASVRLTGADSISFPHQVSLVTRDGSVHEVRFADAVSAAAFRDDFGARARAQQEAQQSALERFGAGVAEGLDTAGAAIAEGAETVRKRAFAAFNALRGAKD